MTGDDRIRAELQALEEAAPSGAPPRRAATPSPRWRRLALPAAVMVIAGTLIGLSVPNWLPGALPFASRVGQLVPVPTGPNSAPSGQPVVCPQALMAGTLVRDPVHGFAVANGDHRTPVRWPNGFVGREGREGLELLNDAGQVAAREGDYIELGGGQGGEMWNACPGPRVVPPEFTGRLEGDANMEGGCIWLRPDSGRRWPIAWPEGYREEFREGQPVLLRDGEVVARAGDEVTVRGAPGDMGYACIGFSRYVATDVAINARPTSPETPPQSVLAWTEVGVFPADSDLSIRVNDAATWAGGIVAVGTQHPPGFGGEQDPRVGRVWVSVDGRQWDDATPNRAFDGVDLSHVFEAADGSLILIGQTYEPSETHYWRSDDAQGWEELDGIGLPDGFLALYAEQGPDGYLIAGGDVAGRVGWSLWFSRDGLSWERVWMEPGDTETREFIHGIAAGDAGFAVNGVAVANMVGDWFLLTSSDGREWAAPSEALGPGAFKIASHNHGWVGMATHEGYGGPYVPPAPVRPTVFMSTDGNPWREVSQMTVQPPTLDGEPRCGTSVTELTSARSWIVMSTEFSCWYGGEGTSRGVQANGTPMISTDGIRWQPLPFAEFSYDTEARETVHTGSIVRLAIATDAGLVLGGESNGNVTFWLGESPDLSPSGAPFDDDPAEVTGVLRGDRTQGIDCIWLTDPQGNRWEIIWPAGYRQEVVEGVATLSLDDQVVAVAGDNITVRGARSSEFGSVCMIGIVYEAAEVIVE